MTNRDWLFVLTLLAVCALTGYVAKRMFDVGVMQNADMSKMYFAAAVLAFLAFIFILSAILYAFGPESNNGTDQAGKAIFEACAKIIPPLVTLIIGFYFGTTQARVNDTSGSSTSAQAPEKVGKSHNSGS